MTEPTCDDCQEPVEDSALCPRCADDRQWLAYERDEEWSA